MTLTEFKNKYLGKKVDFDGYYGGQCVDLYRQYVKDVLGYPQSPGVGGASEIWDSASPDYYEFIPNTPTGIPQRGDIVIWNRRVGGGFGHVAIFLHGDVNKFTSLDQNWPTLSKVTETEHTYSNVIGWLRPKGTMDNELKACMADRQKFWDERDELLRALNSDNVEGGKSAIAGYKSRITDLGNQLGTAQAEVKNREEQVGRLREELLRAGDQIILLDTQLKKVQSELLDMAKSKGALELENGKLKVQVDSLKQQIAQGEITLTISDLIKLILNQKVTIRR